MKRLFLFVCFMSVLAVPAGVLSASAGYEPQSSKSESKVQKDKDKDKDVKDKSVPAPPMLVLLGAAMTVAGASKFWLTRSRL
ncbi:MAG: hypothetical protein ABIX28_01430 [Vicinamibacterales bacterium]